jgi:hypothetical protein
MSYMGHWMCLPEQYFDYGGTDACGIGVGGVLLQSGHPVAYYSKALNPANQKLSIYEQEVF